MTVRPDGSFPRRGEIYWLDFSPSRGSEQHGHRPALVISRDPANRGLPTVVVAALTSRVRYETSKSSVYLPAGAPMKREGTVLAFQLMTASQDRLEDLAGVLTDDQMSQVEAALRFVFGL